MPDLQMSQIINSDFKYMTYIIKPMPILNMLMSKFKILSTSGAVTTYLYPFLTAFGMEAMPAL